MGMCLFVLYTRISYGNNSGCTITVVQLFHVQCCLLKRVMSIGSVLCVDGGGSISISSRSNVACGSGNGVGHSSSGSNLHNYSVITLTINACDIGLSLVE